MEFRTTSNWRHIFTSPEIDFCLGKKWFPKYIEMFNTTLSELFPNKSMDCPFQPAKLYAKDVIVFMGLDKDYKLSNHSNGPYRNGLGLELPNGKYRFTVHMFSKSLDPAGAFVQWQGEVRVRMNDEQF
jgi:hypothetical protein